MGWAPVVRGGGLLLALAAASSCSDRRSFEERYGDTAEQIENRARELDQQVNDPAPAEVDEDEPEEPEAAMDEPAGAEGTSSPPEG